MKQLEASAATEVSAAPADAFALLADVERYPTWYPDVVKRVEVVDRDAAGNPTRARTVLHLAVGPVVRDFHLLLAVRAQPPSAVNLDRVPHEPGDDEQFSVAWTVAPSAAGSRIAVRLAASLPVPRFLPVSGVGESVAQGFVQAASRALQRSG